MLTQSYALIVLLGTAMFAQDAPSKLTPDQMKQFAEVQQNRVIADLSAENGRLKQQIVSLQQALLIAQACDSAGIKFAECEVREDGTVAKKLKAEKK